MKILVATHKTQGKRKNDFAWCDEGEPVGMADECDGEKIDGACGCRRSFSGMKTRKGTTTAKVVDSPMPREAFIEMIVKSEQHAWGASIIPTDEATDYANELLSLAAHFEVGDVVEKRGSKIQVRDVS